MLRSKRRKRREIQISEIQSALPGEQMRGQL